MPPRTLVTTEVGEAARAAARGDAVFQQTPNELWPAGADLIRANLMRVNPVAQSDRADGRSPPPAYRAKELQSVAMGAFVWLLQWPIRAVILLIVAWLPLGVEVESFGIGLLAAVVIGLLGSLLTFPLRLLFSIPWMLTSLGGLVAPVSWLFNWLITVILFGLAAWLIPGFRLRQGLISAVMGAVAYAVLSTVTLRLLGLEVDFTRVSALAAGLPHA